MSIHSETRKYEVVVVGGGLAGVCAAIASARKGARTAIIQNRSMFGGNASSEIRMHIVGANSHGAKKNLGETGILLEILLANKRRNPYASFPVFDSVIWEKVHFQENLESFLNTNMDDVILEGKKNKGRSLSSEQYGNRVYHLRRHLCRCHRARYLSYHVRCDGAYGQ